MMDTCRLEYDRGCLDIVNNNTFNNPHGFYHVEDLINLCVSSYLKLLVLFDSDLFEELSLDAPAEFLKSMKDVLLP